MFANLSLILLIAVTGVFGAKSADRIVGGFSLNITQAPWQVSLQQDSGTYQFCGGSIIGNQWILTAAHCLSRPMQIRVGATHKYSEGHLIDVKRRYVHKKHSYGEDDYDFGLLQLAADLEFSDSVKPIRLPDFGDAFIKNGTICLASGWGKTRNASESSDLLRGVQVPTVDQQICNAAYEGKITPRMICAGYKDGGKDSCQGDSGGPLVATYNAVKEDPVLVGIVSWGFGCGEAGYPGVYARVAAVREWIYSVTKI